MTKGRKRRLMLLALFLAAVMAAGIWLVAASVQLRRSWESVDENDIVWPELSVAGQQLRPYSAQWVQSTLTGSLWDPVFEKIAPQYASRGVGVESDSVPPQFSAETTHFALSVPEGYVSVLTVKAPDGTQAFSGSAEDYAAAGGTGFAFSVPGIYEYRLKLTTPQSGDGASGSFEYLWLVEAKSDPTVRLQKDTAAQGDAVAVLVENNVYGEPMTISTELGLCDFVPLGGGTYAAFAPVAYNRAPGTWEITVTVGERTWPLSVEVQASEFPTQYMTISQDTADATWNSSDARSEYRAAIYPLYDEVDNEKYWDGRFIEPVTGYRVSTEYGTIRYTNGVFSEYHSGVDLACDKGTPVAAPQNGVVLYAGYLQLTGNTVVIAHGGGLKSMFYHMDSLACAAGDRVTTGQKIGEVGTTGYSTGPHLHYEVKIGSQSINPWELFDGTSEIYAGQDIG